VKLYGDSEPDQSLIDSIRSVGILNPIIVNEEGEIISGNRRYKAYMHLYDENPRPQHITRWLVVRLAVNEHLGYERMVIDSNVQRVKTKGQIAREAAALLRIEKEMAAEREKAGKRNRSVNLRKGRASKLVGEQLGISERTVEKAAEVVAAAESGDKEAVAALELLDKNEASFSAAFKKVEKAPKDEAAIAAQEADAEALSAWLKANSGFDCEVKRGKEAGTYHVILHRLTEVQVRSLVSEKIRKAA